MEGPEWKIIAVIEQQHGICSTSRKTSLVVAYRVERIQMEKSVGIFLQLFKEEHELGL